MKQYISKDAIVAEIERRKQVAFGWMETAPNDAIEAEFELCDDILSFINTLEVKEVDLKAEIERLIKSYSPIWSSEGKYRVEAYKEILDFINSNCLEISRSWNSHIGENNKSGKNKINKLCEVKRYDENGKVYSVMLPDTRLFMNKINDVIDAIDNIESRLQTVEQKI